MRERVSTRPKQQTRKVEDAAVRTVQFALSIAGRQVLLSHGEQVIGRDRDCDLIFDDQLVSRRHARLLVSRGALFVEDLKSANGVVVNECAISGPTPLHDGDRLSIGSQEIVVVETCDDAATLPPDPPSTRPLPRVPRLARPENVQVLALPVEASAHPAFDGGDGGDSTLKQESVVTMARVADRMIARGRPEAAVSVVGEHLRVVVTKAKEGQEIPEPVFELVATYAAKLALITRSPTWADLAIELHLTARRSLSEKLISAIEQLGLPLDEELLRRYVDLLSELSESLTPSEQAVRQRVQKLSRS